MLKYITKIKINFCPFNESSKSARLFLSRVGNSACESTNPQCSIETKVQSDLKAPSSIFIKFKDGKEFNLNAEKLSIDDIFQVVNKQTRKLALLDESK